MMTLKPMQRKLWFWQRVLLWGLALLVGLALIAIVGLFLVLKSGISSAFLAEQINTTINERLADKAQLDIANASLILDDRFHLVVESRDVGLNYSDGQGAYSRAQIGKVSVSVAALALLQGQLNVKQIALSDLEMSLPSGQDNNFLQKLPQDGAGRIDFDALSNLLFNAIEQGNAAFERQKLEKISIERVALNFFFRGKPQQLGLEKLILERQKGTSQLNATLHFAGQEMLLAGMLHHEVQAKEIARTIFQLTLKQTPLNLGAAEDGAPHWDDGQVKNGYFRLSGLGAIEIEGVREAQQQKIGANIVLPHAQLDLADRVGMAASASIVLEHDLGSERIRILPSQLTVEMVEVNFSGYAAPMPPLDLSSLQKMEQLETDNKIIDMLVSNADIEGKYQFMLDIYESKILATDGPDIDFAAQVSGELASQARQINFETLSLQTKAGSSLNGKGSLRMAPPGAGQLLIGSQTPEAKFSFQATNVQIGEAKQMWPFNVASGTRQFLLQHIEEGNLPQVQLILNLPLDFYHQGKPRYPLRGEELRVKGQAIQVRAKLLGDLPELEHFETFFEVEGMQVRLHKGSGQVLMEGKTSSQPTLLHVSKVSASIMRPPFAQDFANIEFQIAGQGAAMLHLIGRDPIKAGGKLPFKTEDFSGTVQANMQLHFPLPDFDSGKKIAADDIEWRGVVDFQEVAFNLPLEIGRHISDARGQAEIDRQKFLLNAQAMIDGMPAIVTMDGETTKPEARTEKIILEVDDATRERLLPALSPFISGSSRIEIEAQGEGMRHFTVDLTPAIVEIPWLGWKKGQGVRAQAQFRSLINPDNAKNIIIEDFSLKGDSFLLEGKIDIREGMLSSASFSKAHLNRGDNMSLTIRLDKGRYHVKAQGKAFDMRSFIKWAGVNSTSSTNQSEAVDIELDLAQVTGFYDTYLYNFKAHFTRNQAGREEGQLTARTAQNGAIEMHLFRQFQVGQLRISSDDSGAILRFFAYYDKVENGRLELDMQLGKKMIWSGSFTLHDFQIVDEPRLARIVANPPPSSKKSLNDVSGGKINVSRLPIEVAVGQMVRGENFLALERGILRGPTIGATFQGLIYDAAGNISMTGTFMPAYGLNRIFSRVPLLGNLLGNGRDRGLIGITFKVDGKAKNPRIIVNPLSVIAPGIFRQIFEFQQ